MQMLIIDRFEGDIVVVEADNNMLELPRDKFSGDVSEGDIIIFENDMYHADKVATLERRSKIAARLRNCTK